MVLNLTDLNEEVREYMLVEVDNDIERGTLYLSRRFNEHGRRVYRDLLREAVQYHNEDWLARELVSENAFKSMERGTAWGRPSISRVDWNAPITLAEGEFNNFYMRGLCLYALRHGIPELEIYRAKVVDSPRLQSVIRIGQLWSPEILLEDLRAPIGSQTISGMPGGPNSGLSLQIPR